jgi:type VI protein secretion system component VasF
MKKKILWIGLGIIVVLGLGFGLKKRQEFLAELRPRVEAAKKKSMEDSLVRQIAEVRSLAEQAPDDEVRQRYVTTLRNYQEELKKRGYADQFPEAMAPLKSP